MSRYPRGEIGPGGPTPLAEGSVQRSVGPVHTSSVVTPEVPDEEEQEHKLYSDKKAPDDEQKR